MKNVFIHVKIMVYLSDNEILKNWISKNINTFNRKMAKIYELISLFKV